MTYSVVRRTLPKSLNGLIKLYTHYSFHYIGDIDAMGLGQKTVNSGWQLDHNIVTVFFDGESFSVSMS